MNNIKRTLSNFVKSSDLLSHNVSLRHSGNSNFESLCTGFVSIVAFLVFFVIFILKLLVVLQLQDITAFQHLTDNLESSQPIDDIMFAMTIDGLNMSTIEKYFGFAVTEVTLSRPSGTTVPKTRTQRIIPLLPCKISYWQNMNIANMDTLFTKRGMSGYFCPVESFTIQGTSDEDTYIYSEIKLTPCVPMNPFCENNATIRQAYYQSYVDANQYFTVKLLMKDSIISPTAQNAVSNFIEKDILITFSTTTGTLGYIQIADYEIQTDTNILPWSLYNTTSGYYIFRFQTTTVPSTTQFMQVKLDKSTRKFSVERQYGKIDDLLSYVGGLFGLLFYCVQFVMGSYNQYRYELSVAQALFNYDEEGNQAKSDDMGFWTYVKYSIYDWFDFFGIELSKWTSMKQIHETREEANEQMDVRHLMQKIRYLENVVEVLVTDEQRICLLLSDLPTMDKVQKVRKVVEYYNSQKHHEKQKEDEKIDDEKKIGSDIQLVGNMNNSNFLINQIANEQYARKNNLFGYQQNAIKETIQNEAIEKQESENEFVKEVAKALLMIMINGQDPINKKILQKLKPHVKTKIQRSKTFSYQSPDPQFINLKPEQKMNKHQNQQ